MEFTLRKWRWQDAEDVARYANNENIAKNLRDAFPYPYTLEDAKDYVEGCVREDETKQLCRAIVVEGHAVGSIGIFREEDVYRMSAELGYWLAEEYWGQGIMSQAVARLCREVFDRWDIVRIHAWPFAQNTGSRRVLEKAGFTLEGTIRQGVCKRGEIFDYCVYGMLRAEWEG